MAAIGSVWASGTWSDDIWGDGTWGTALDAEEVAYQGKYRPEWAGALEAVRGARGFSAEHASALRQVSDAGR